jgi:hypothetical protein
MVSDGEHHAAIVLVFPQEIDLVGLFNGHLGPRGLRC